MVRDTAVQHQIDLNLTSIKTVVEFKFMKKEKEKSPQIVQLKEGDIIELEKGHIVYAEIAEKYVYENTPKSDNLTKTDVTIGNNRKGLDTSYLVGRYAVVKTAFDGGGTGMGPHDIFPDGHHVWCRRMLENGEFGEQIEFYQSGCFTAMIEEIKPVGKVEFKYFEESKRK